MDGFALTKLYIGLQDHEGAQDDEEPAADIGGGVANIATLYAEGFRHQEGKRGEL